MMTLEQEGAYIRLVAYCWQHGDIPRDPEEAARLIGKGASTTLAESVLLMFIPAQKRGRLTHDRLESQKLIQAAWREKSAEGGRKSAEMRSKGGARVVKPPYQPKGNSPTPTPISNNIREEGAALSQSSEVSEIFESWNKTVGLTKCLLVSDKRRRALQIRFSEAFFSENWSSALSRIADSKFCNGVNDRGWKATFDWFISPDVVTKIMEGKYDDRNGTAVLKPNPRNFGIAIGPTNYGTAKPRLQREIEEKRRLAKQVASNENPPPTT